MAPATLWARRPATHLARCLSHATSKLATNAGKKALLTIVGSEDTQMVKTFVNDLAKDGIGLQTTYGDMDDWDQVTRLQALSLARRNGKTEPRSASYSC